MKEETSKIEIMVIPPYASISVSAYVGWAAAKPKSLSLEIGNGDISIGAAWGNSGTTPNITFLSCSGSYYNTHNDGVSLKAGYSTFGSGVNWLIVVGYYFLL